MAEDFFFIHWILYRQILSLQLVDRSFFTGRIQYWHWTESCKWIPYNKTSSHSLFFLSRSDSKSNFKPFCRHASSHHTFNRSNSSIANIKLKCSFLLCQAFFRFCSSNPHSKLDYSFYLCLSNFSIRKTFKPITTYRVIRLVCFGWLSLYQ